MPLLEDPEPPSSFNVRKELMGTRLSMYVVRRSEKFVTAFRTRNECEVWIRNESKRIRRSDSG